MVMSVTLGFMLYAFIRQSIYIYIYINELYPFSIQRL